MQIYLSKYICPPKIGELAGINYLPLKVTVSCVDHVMEQDLSSCPLLNVLCKGPSDCTDLRYMIEVNIIGECFGQYVIDF